MFVGRQLCAGAILDFGDISPLLLCSGKLDPGLWDLLQFQVACPAFFFNKGNWTGIEKGELGSIGVFAKTTGNCPIFHFFSQKEDKNVHSSRAGILFLLLTAPFPVWTVPSI